MSILFYFLSFSRDGNVDNSLLYRVGTFIEPVTKFFGMGWQTFMAFVSGAFAKEAVLGTLNAVFMGDNSLMEATFFSKTSSTDTSLLGTAMSSAISPAEALAFINITGGTIHITTTSESYDVIELNSSDWYHQLSPLQWVLENRNTGSKIVAQAGGIFFYQNNTQKMLISANGSITATGAIQAAGGIGSSDNIATSADVVVSGGGTTISLRDIADRVAALENA